MYKSTAIIFVVLLAVSLPTWYCHAEASADGSVDGNLKGEKIALQTDSNTVAREEQAMSATGFSVAEKKLLDENTKQYQFQAEVDRLMSLIVNSLYSTREIFLRELISNASDALDKIRYEALTSEGVLGDKPELEIRLKPDPENNVLHIIDTGVGMTAEDLIRNLGTIAKSGTKEFLEKVDQSNADSFIGQFGVGFYSCFLVADEVFVTSKNNNDDQYVWRSTLGSGTAFSLAKDPRGNTLGRGTQISLVLKDDASEYLEPKRLRELVHKYSEFINFPIYLYESHTEERNVPVAKDETADDEKPAKSDDDDTKDDADASGDEEEEEEEFEVVEETVWEWALLNDVAPLWTRDPKDVSDEEYTKFYKAISKDIEAPAAWTHFKAEGDLEFRAILYVPSDPPSNAFETGKNTPRGVKLYVRRVFITDNFDLLIPKYLSFVKGVVDSNSLQLNVSREILQQDKSLKQMEKKLVRKIIAMIQELAEDKTKYESFYDDFRVWLKLGMIEDSANRSRLSKLLRYTSTKSSGEVVSLDQYIERMQKGQTKIYYIAGESEELLQKSPLLESLVRRGYEVLFWTDPLDEYMAGTFTEYEGKKLVNISKEGELDIETEEEKEKEKEVAEEFKDLVEYLKKTLTKKISKAVVSSRLSRSPSAIVSSGFGYTANMERILKAQALNQQQSTFMAPRKVMEINPRHPIIQELHRRVAQNEDDPDAKVIAEVLFDTAALNSGFSIDDPSDFATRIHRMMKLSLNLDADVEPVDDDAAAAADADAPVDDAAAAAADEVEASIEDSSAEL